jgi:serine/threonine-protein kinase PknG
LNPEQIIMVDPKVPDHKRFCSNPDCHDDKGNPTALNRRLSGHCPNCGKPYSFVPTLTAGEVVCEQYEVKGCLAYGGLGWIYLAKDISLSRWVVMKGLLNSTDESAAAAAVAERQFLASVKHPNIVSVYNFAKRGTEGYIVMEYVGGTTLKDVRKSRGPLPPAEAISYIHRILGAFAYLHDRGLVYCDFKPDNFMLEGDPPDVKLIDMGGVRLIDDLAGDIYGTKGYSAPEAGEGPTVATDLFTIARTLAVLLMDFRYQSVFEFTMPSPGEQPVLAQHESLYRFLLKATAKDPAGRFQSADAMAEQLSGVLREVVVIDSGEMSSRPADSTLFMSEAAGLEDDDAINQPAPALLPELRIDSDDPGADELFALAMIRDVKRPPMEKNGLLSGRSPRSDNKPTPRIVALQTAAKKNPTSIEIPLQLAYARIKNGNFAEADSILTSVASKSANDWRVSWYRGLSLLHQNQLREASVVFDLVYSELPGEPAAKLALALSAELLGNDLLAIGLYDLVSRVDPRFATAAFGLARCLRRAGRRAEAADAYRRVPETSSVYIRAQTALARALASMQPAPPAAEDLCQAASVIDTLALAGVEQAHLRAEVLENALALLQAKTLTPDASRKMFGQPLAETPVRFALEASLRQMARLEPDRDRQVALVDKANSVRPWTWI